MDAVVTNEKPPVSKLDELTLSQTIKQLENSIGQLYESIYYLEPPNGSSNDDMDFDEMNNEESLENLSGSTLSRGNRMLLSLKIDHPSSIYSETDSGIGTSTPFRKYPEDFSQRLNLRNSLKPLNLRDRPDTPPVYRLSGKLNEDTSTPRGSVKSFTIALGHTDGKKVIRKSETTPETLLMLPVKCQEDIHSSKESFQRSAGGSFDDYRRPFRVQWNNKAQFIMACVGYSVGLGNIWRFPYVCYKSGGGAFLVPYFLALVICGIPLLYMELAIGQYTSRGPIGALGKLCPLLKGAGLSSVVISFIMSTYYTVIIAYTLYYLFSALKSTPPWTTCDHFWNTNECWQPSRLIQYNITRPNLSRTPSQEFYDHKVLQVTSGIEEMGGVRWELAACLLVAWILVYFSIWKSVKSSGKVLYFTATFPYIIILAFLVRSLTLEGAESGLKYLFRPKWQLLLDAKVWVYAAGQVFNSMGLAFGSVVSFASYNKKENAILADTIAVTAINGLTSLMVAIFAFATIGNIAFEHNTSVHDVITDGPGLVFVVYPQAMGKMPASEVWAIMFFAMLLCLGLNSQFAIVEVVVTTIQDGFPNWIRRHFISHEVLVLLVCFISLLFGIPNVFQGGIYFFQLIDHFAASVSLMYLAFFEVIAVAWCYGVHRLRENVKSMTGETISFYFRFCWLLATPIFLLSIWIFSLIDYVPPSYRNGEYRYPKWAEAMGWAVASLSLACIPCYAAYVYFTADGDSFQEKFEKSITPRPLECDICCDDSCIHVARTTTTGKEMENLLKDKYHQPQLVPAASAVGKKTKEYANS